MDYLLSQIETIMRTAQETYGVNPVIFLVIYLGCAPIFYYSLIRTLRALAKKTGNEILVWSMVFLAATVAPFVYVILFGRNIPWWVYVLIAILVGQGVFSLVTKLRKGGNPTGGSSPLPPDGK
jgi:hypothetical protein